MTKRLVFIAISILMVSSYFFYQHGRSIWFPVMNKFMQQKTVNEVLNDFGDKARNNLKPHFQQVGINYPPKSLALIAYKDSDILEVWASNNSLPMVKVHQYDVKAASGILGPKLREGDKQVPEGSYKIIGFNPNSAYHVSMKLNYPNSFDLKHAKTEGRTSPGSNIFIHGKAASVGCLAMGDPAIEELFTLVHDSKRSNTQVLIAPNDPRITPLKVPAGAPEWTAILYEEIAAIHQGITGTN